MPGFFADVRERAVVEAAVSGAGNGRGAAPRPAAVEADTGKGPAETAAPPGQPGLRFGVTGVSAIRHAAVPTLSFTLDVEDASGREVFTAALTIQIQIEPVKRSYEPEERERLAELFGEPHRWATSAQRMLWTTESVLLPAFKGSASVEVPVLCNYDLELAATKYFHSVEEGEIPLSFHFNGSVYYAGEGGRLQIVQIPWDTDADLQDAARDLEGDDRRLLPVPGLGAAPARDAGGAAPPQGRARAADLRRRRWLELLAEAEGVSGRRRRGAGRLAALRGLRALPVHARRDQERDADPVRDRLPAGLRRGPARRVRPRAARVRCWRPGPRRSCAGRSASCRPPASGTRASSGASSWAR